MKPEFEITYQFTAENVNHFGALIIGVCAFPALIAAKFSELEAELNKPDADGANIGALIIEMRSTAHDTARDADTLAQTLGQSVPVRIAGGKAQ